MRHHTRLPPCMLPRTSHALVYVCSRACQIRNSQKLSLSSAKYKKYTEVADVEFTSFDIDTAAPAAKVILELFRACAAN